MRNLAMLF